MPAYLKELAQQWCQKGCGASATVEVFNTRNESHGLYCRRHGRELVKLLEGEAAS